MAAVAGEFRAAINEEVAVIVMLVGGEAIARLEEKVSAVGVPGTPGVNVAGTGRKMRERQGFQIAYSAGGVATEKIIVGVVAGSDARSLVVEGVNHLVERIVAVMTDEDAAGGELFVAIATEGASAAIAHGDRTARVVFT